MNDRLKSQRKSSRSHWGHDAIDILQFTDIDTQYLLIQINQGIDAWDCDDADTDRFVAK